MKTFIKILLTFLIATLIAINLPAFGMVDTNIIAKIESNNNPDAIGDNGKAIGIYQIHKCVIDDVNKHFNTSYTWPESAKDTTTAKEIMCYYLELGQQIYYKKHNKYPTEYELVRMWNGGIYQGYKIKATKKYLIKYMKNKKIKAYEKALKVISSVKTQEQLNAAKNYLRNLEALYPDEKLMQNLTVLLSLKQVSINIKTVYYE